MTKIVLILKELYRNNEKYVCATGFETTYDFNNLAKFSESLLNYSSLSIRKSLKNGRLLISAILRRFYLA